MPLRENEEAKQRLATLLFQCFNALKVYGKEPEQLADTVALFQRVLGKYTYREIEEAFDDYLSKKTEMPAPADIVSIIDPPQEHLSGAVYLEIKKRLREGTVYVDRDEKAYCAAYEAQEMGKVRGGSDELKSYQRQVESYTKTLGYEGE